jgi:YD repeat-containing protein
VEFSYETRIDNGPLYVPTLMEVDMRLKYIMVYIDGNLLRKYRLDYEQSASTGRSRLKEIQEYGKEGNWPTTFEVDEYFIPTGSVMALVSFNWGENCDDTEIEGNTFHETSYHEDHNIYPGDYNGDGIIDLLFFKKSSGNILICLILNNKNIVKNINNGNGGEINITYTPAPQVEGAINPDGKSYPVISNKSPRPLVTGIDIDPGTGPSIIYTYEYSDGKIYMGKPHERVNLGFAWTKKTDYNSGQSVVTYYHQDDKDLHGLVSMQENYGGDGYLYTRKTVEVQKQVLIDNSGRPRWHDVLYITKQNEFMENFNGDEVNEPLYFLKEFEYDQYGNPSRVTDLGEVEKVGESFVDVYYDKTEVQTSFIVNQSNWVMRPEYKETYAYTLSDSWERVIAEYNKYDYEESYGIVDKGLLTCTEQVKSQSGGEQLITYKYFYDDYGNLTQTYDPRRNNGEYTNPTAVITYDGTYKTWIESKQNALGQTSTTVYDNLMRLVQKIDINGVAWTTVYDDFGRVTATISPGDDGDNPTARTYYSAPGVYPL